MTFVEWIRIILIGIIEGITEWLPISSTGHMLLFDQIFPTTAPEVFTPEFNDVFMVVIQLGAILAVLTCFFGRLNPVSRQKTREEKKSTWSLWGKVIVGCLPAAVAGLLFDDWMEEHLYNYAVIAAMLIVYGVLFIVLEIRNRRRTFKVQTVDALTYRHALIIGIIQVLSLIPGTSRSGVTILGAMLIGCSRSVAAEYTFFLAIPVMIGASGFRIVMYFIDGSTFTLMQVAVMLAAMAVAYVVSMLAIKFLMKFVRRHDFKIFGVYRIALGVLVLALFPTVFGITL